MLPYEKFLLKTANNAPYVTSANTHAGAQPHPSSFDQRLTGGIVGGVTEGTLHAMMAPPEDRWRQAAIGAASGLAGGMMGRWGILGAPAVNALLQNITAPKYAEHADDRLKERITYSFPPGMLDDLREQAKKLDVAPGRYYLPLKGKDGNTKAVAAFKTVGENDKLVLATILKPRNNAPKGKSLSHLLRQPTMDK